MEILVECERERRRETERDGDGDRRGEYKEWLATTGTSCRSPSYCAVFSINARRLKGPGVKRKLLRRRRRRRPIPLYRPPLVNCFCARVSASAFSRTYAPPFGGHTRERASHDFVLKGIKLLTRPLAPCDEPFVFARTGAARFNYVKTVY